MICLSKIILLSKKKDDIFQASSLQKKMGSFEFILLLVFQSKVLENVNRLSKTLQNIDIAIGEACDLLDILQENLIPMRNEFDSLNTEVEEIARSWNVDISFPHKRNRRGTKFYAELCSDTVFTDQLERFKITVFLCGIGYTNKSSSSKV